MNFPIELETLEKLIKDLNLLYENTTVFPPKKQIFRAFSYFKPEETKVVILGQDPYHNLYKGVPSACGLAFATENGYINPSMRLIFEELNKSGYPKQYNPSIFIKWAEQEKVLLLNTALTVEKGKPGSHVKIWNKFIKELISELGKQDIVWLLMGKNAEKYQDLIKGPKVIVPHPMAQIYSGGNIKFVGSNCFFQINEELVKLNKTPVKWNI